MVSIDNISWYLSVCLMACFRMSNKTIAEQENKIKDSLFEFIKKYIPDADLSLVDEIVLSYVVAILEDVSSDPVFDVEGLYFRVNIVVKLKQLIVLKILKLILIN